MSRFSQIVECIERLRQLPAAAGADFSPCLDKAANIEARDLQFNSFAVSQLVDEYKKLVSQVFSFSHEELFSDLLKIFDSIFPLEAFELRKYFSEYGFHSDTIPNGNMLIKGDIQSGKTLMMILGTLCYLASGKDVIIIVRNKIDDKLQFMERFRGIVSRLGKEFGFSNKQFQIACNSDPIASQGPCAFIEIFHSGNISKLYERLKTRSLRSMVMYIDEADLRANYTQKLFKEVGKTIYVSATVQDIIVSDWKIKTRCVVNLPAPAQYKGIKNLSIISERNILDETEFFYTLCDIAVDTEYEGFRADHPKVVLINIDSSLNAIGKYFESFKADKFDVGDMVLSLPKDMKNSCVIRYTGSGIDLFHSSLEKNEAPTKGMNVSRALRWLWKNGGKERFPTVVIVAGCMADRGINFSDYESGWHLTHQVLLKPDSSSCAGVLQSCRILGVHRDSIPLKLYTTKSIEKKILKGYNTSESIVKQLQESKSIEYTDDVCSKEIRIFKEDARALDGMKFLSRKKATKIFKIISREKEIRKFECDEPVDGYLVPRNKKQQKIFEELRILMLNYRKTWVKRSILLSSHEREWDLRELYSMQNESKSSTIGYRKINNLVEYIFLD